MLYEIPKNKFLFRNHRRADTMMLHRTCLLLVAFAATMAAASSGLPAESAPVGNGTAPSPSPAPASGNHTDKCSPGECSGLGCLFVDVTCANVVPMNFGGTVQLLFLTLVYAYLLFFASNLISDGSELLLLVRDSQKRARCFARKPTAILRHPG